MAPKSLVHHIIEIPFLCLLFPSGLAAKYTYSPSELYIERGTVYRDGRRVTPSSQTNSRLRRKLVASSTMSIQQVKTRLTLIFGKCDPELFRITLAEYQNQRKLINGKLKGPGALV